MSTALWALAFIATFAVGFGAGFVVCIARALAGELTGV